jgi:DNA-binding beta-propeller fold protein YncE
MSAANVTTNHLMSRILLILVASALVLVCDLPQTAVATEGEDAKVFVQVIAQLTLDEEGERLRYPSSIAYDRDMDEIYVVVGGEGKIIVYGSNFFPTVSLAAGRGADSPRTTFIDKDGMLYVCQGANMERSARITIFNPAFFPVGEINLDTIPGVENFSPINMTIGMTGNIYVAGENTRGLLVLNKEGEFLRWLTPEDRIFDQRGMLADINLSGIEGGEEEEKNQETEDEIDQLDMLDMLPKELQPSTNSESQEVQESTIGPVRVRDVASDSEGHLYILSEETGKVYVYSHNEELLFSFGQKGGSTGKMSRPKSLVIDEKKKAVYIVDYMRHTILIFDQGGTFMYEFGGLGTGPGWFQYPTGLGLTRDGYLMVADLFNNRVQILDVHFEYKFPLFQEMESSGQSPGVTTPDEVEEEIKNQMEDQWQDGDILEPRPL